MTGWQRTYERAQQLAAARDAIRLTNLAIAAIAGRATARPDGGRLQHDVAALAVGPAPEVQDSLFDWQALADEAHTAARELIASGRTGHDQWVQSFQAADPARKSRGAYATPTVLARAMAKLVLADVAPPERILDPSTGGGTLLLACFDMLTGARPDKQRLTEAVNRLHGVELDSVARELCCLQLWLAARVTVDLGEITARVHQDNAITRGWEADGPYDALIMNPPWDSLRHIDQADDAERRRTIARLDNPTTPQSDLPPLFTSQGRGDRNLYKAFVELAPHLVAEQGRIVALVPGAWSSDLGTRELRGLYIAHTQIEQWTSFENRQGYFPIDGRYKFGVLAARRDRVGTRTIRTLGMVDDIDKLNARHISLPANALETIGGPARLIPDLTDDREADLLTRIRANGRPFFDPHPQLGLTHYDREIDLTEDRKRGLFARLEQTDAQRIGPDTWATADGRHLRPLLEGRMVGQYDFLEKSWVSGHGRRAEWTYNNGHRLLDCQAQFLAPPTQVHRHRVALCDVTSATNTRTVLAAWVPPTWQCGNTAPVLVFATARQALTALAVLNSLVFDWQARRIVSGLHLNRFYLQAMSWPDLGDEAAVELADRAIELLSLQPRFRDIAPDLAVDSTPVDYVAAHQRIETLVAGGFGLRPADLDVILDPSERHRRGFWRHLAADPDASLIAVGLRSGATVSAI